MCKKNDELQLEVFLKLQGTMTCLLNKEAFIFIFICELVMPMFTRFVSLKEVDFISYIDSKFADLKEEFVKELKEDLLLNIVS